MLASDNAQIQNAAFTNMFCEGWLYEFIEEITEAIGLNWKSPQYRTKYYVCT